MKRQHRTKSETKENTGRGKASENPPECYKGETYILADELFWHVLSAKEQLFHKYFFRNNREFVTQQEIVCVSFLNKE